MSSSLSLSPLIKLKGYEQCLHHVHGWSLPLHVVLKGSFPFSSLLPVDVKQHVYLTSSLLVVSLSLNLSSFSSRNHISNSAHHLNRLVDSKQSFRPRSALILSLLLFFFCFHHKVMSNLHFTEYQQTETYQNHWTDKKRKTSLEKRITSG